MKPASTILEAHRQFEIDLERGAILRSPESFRDWLRRVLVDVSQRDLGAASGVDHSTISRLATGRHEPTISVANALIVAVRARR